jgi:2-phosphoglycerate kinase
MAKAYFIGGPPRVGKSTLALQAIAKHPMLATTTDALRYVLWDIMPGETTPDLYAVAEHEGKTEELLRHHLQTKPQDFLDAYRRESAAVWQHAVLKFVESNLMRGRDVLIEGTAILPEFVTRFDGNYTSIFLGNQSPAHTTFVQKLTRTRPQDWMAGYSNETIEAYMNCYQLLDEQIERETKRHGLPFIQVADDSFEQTLGKALKILLSA